MRQLPSAFVQLGDFCQLLLLTVRQGNLVSTFVNYLCSRVTFCQVSSAWKLTEGLPAVWNVDGSRLEVFRPCRKLMEIDFCQISVPPRKHPSTSVNCLFHRENFSPLMSSFCAARRPSVNFPCDWDAFRQFTSTFRATGMLSVNSRQLSVRQRDLLSTSINLLPGDLPSTSVHFLCGLEPSINIH